MLLGWNIGHVNTHIVARGFLLGNIVQVIVYMVGRGVAWMEYRAC